MQDLPTNKNMALDNDYLHDGQQQDYEMDSNVPKEDNDDEVEGLGIDMEFEATSSGDDSDPDDKTHETISHLENLALSFLSQLTESLKPKQKKDSNGLNSRQEAPPSKKGIILELAKRGKSSSGSTGPKLRSIQFPKNTKWASSKAPAQLLKVASEAHEALISRAPMTKRDVYYRDVSLFKGQATVDALVDDLAATFSVNRSDLNIRASSKGLYCGSALTIHLHDGTYLVGHETEASLIPVGQDIAEFEINEDIAWILVVEKDAVFQTLRSAGLTNHPALLGPGLLITGKGYPDIATRQLVRTFSDNMPEKTRILALVDADAYGLDIVSVYKNGSANMRHENESLAAERVEWIGVSASEALSLGVDRDALLPITVHDHRKALSLLQTSNNLPETWKHELMHMLHIRRKAEIEVLSTLPSTSLSDSLKEENDLEQTIAKITNPLVRYVIWKINSALDF